MTDDVKVKFYELTTSTYKKVKVVVPDDANLLNEPIIEQLFRDAISFICANNYNHNSRCPYTLIEIWQKNELAVETFTGYSAGQESVLAAVKSQTKHHLRNKIDEKRKQMAMIEAKNNSRRAFNQLTGAYRVTDFVSVSKLDANPFVFEGDNVLLRARFREMVSKTDGLIESENRRFILSDIPRARFTDSGPVLVVAKVIGKKQGMTTMKYLDARTCGDFSCKEYLLWRE